MGCCNVVAIMSMADMTCLDCSYAETVQCMSSAGSVEFFLAEILLLLKHGRCTSSFMCKTGVSKADTLFIQCVRIG